MAKENFTEIMVVVMFGIVGFFLITNLDFTSVEITFDILSQFTDTEFVNGVLENLVVENEALTTNDSVN